MRVVAYPQNSLETHCHYIYTLMVFVSSFPRQAYENKFGMTTDSTLLNRTLIEEI